MKKHNLKKSITRILACALLVATLGLFLASCTIGDKAKDTAGKVWDTAKDGAEKIYDAVKDKITMEQTDDFGQISLLSLYTGTETVDEKDVVYQIIQATVLPDSATDKSTTWEVYWIDNQTGIENAEVTDYVTVLACTADKPYNAQPGSNYCKVTCKKPFAGSTIGVRVTTVVGGFTAECKVTYEGAPTYLGFHKVLAEGGYEHVTGQQRLEIGATDFALALDNPLHGVGSNYGQFAVTSVQFEGKIRLYYDLGGTKHYAPNEYIDLSDYAAELSSKGDESLNVSNFITASIGDGTLQVQCKSAVSGYTIAGDSVMYTVETEAPVVFSVTVKDTVSGVSNTLRFSILDVSSVSLSDSTLTF